MLKGSEGDKTGCSYSELLRESKIRRVRTKCGSRSVEVLKCGSGNAEVRKYYSDV